MELHQYFQQTYDDLKTLEGDISRIILSQKEEEKDDKQKDEKEKKKGVNLKSLQSVTKLYKSKEEIEEAKKSPEIDFVTKQIDKIFSK